MSQLVALSLSIGLLGGVFTWLVFGTLSVWAGFIAWACFFHNGGDTNALKQTIVGNIVGAVLAWVAAYAVLQFSLPAGVGVGVTVFVLCMLAHVKLLSSIPTMVYGYAATFAIMLIDTQRFAIASLVDVNYHSNPLLQVTASMIVGALFGFASGKLAGALTKKG